MSVTAESTNPKDKIGKTKPPLDLIPPAANIIESMVMGLGARKYGPFNWREHSVAARVYIGAAKRHQDAWMDGEDNDPESGVCHLAHARACLGIMLDAMTIGKLVDDRPPKGAAASLIREYTKTEAKPQDIRADDGSYLPIGPQDVYTLDLDAPAIPETTLPVVEPEPADRNTELLKRLYGGEFDALCETPCRPEPFTDLRDRDYQTLRQIGCKPEVAKQIAESIRYCADAYYAGYVYIAGPMRGYRQFNFPAFDAARDEFLRRGFNVISPADIDRACGGIDEHSPDGVVPPAVDNKVFIYRDFFALLFVAHQTSGGVVYLPKWESSTGAAGEFFLSRWFDLAPYAPDGSILSSVDVGVLASKVIGFLESKGGK